jgi:Recombinase zinc beta ribbon domain
MRRPLAEWDVLLKDQHEGYISWMEFERNQTVIADNATGKGGAVARGAARHWELLLAGLLRCGHCGRKMYVAYGGKAVRYHCEGALVNHGAGCISFGGLPADQAVGTEVLRVLKPFGVDAAVRARRQPLAERRRLPCLDGGDLALDPAHDLQRLVPPPLELAGHQTGNASG